MNSYSVLLTNARSLAPKINSLQTFVQEHDVDIALITESWLRDSEVLDRDVIDLEYGSKLKILYKNRPRRVNGLRRVGGGVSVVFNKDRCSLRERKIVGNDYELVAATGRIRKIGRVFAVFCIYIEPRTKTAELEKIKHLLTDEVLAVKAAFKDPLIIVGGDMNRRDLASAFEPFDDIKQANFAPTRRDACLDIIFSNANGATTKVWPPLETDRGIKSDHSCVVMKAGESKERDFTWVRKLARKHTHEACEQFGAELRATDWNNLLPVSSSPDELVAAFEEKTSEMMNRLFPLTSTRHRSNEDPWITDGIRKLAKRKARVYRREKKSDYWQALQRRLSKLIFYSKQQFIARVRQGGTSTKAYFRAVRQLGGSQPREWSARDLYPGLSPEQTGDKVTEFFTKITNQFNPLAPSANDAPMRRPMSTEEVTKKLADSKKPNSQVAGDIMPKLMKKFYRELAPGVRNIFNSVFRTNQWPTRWKTETTVVIPKVANPSSLAETRNISCTAFLSKVLESVLLEDLRAEIPPDTIQYGGIKACSVDHLLVDLYEEILGALDEGDSAVLMGIDFEKAFNRLNHQECLRQLERLGASDTSIALVRSFLTGRSMRAKIDGQLSAPRNLNGGSPQGSILGCLLYCLTTQQIDHNLATIQATPSPPAHEPVRLRTDAEHSPPSPGHGFGLMETAVPGLQATSPERDTSGPDSSDSFLTAESPSLDALDVHRPYCIHCFKYVDDTTTFERVHRHAGIRHISTAVTTELIPADLTNALLGSMAARARDIGMKINCGKTQVAVLSPDNGCLSFTKLHSEGETLTSSDHIKLLGFEVSVGMDRQVTAIKAKFRAKFWSLIHLNRAGIRGLELYHLYCIFIRPTLESNAVIIHPQLTRHQCHEIERLQMHVLKLCFGFDKSYAQARNDHNIPTLEQRREKIVEKFVAKALQNPRFRTRWFPERPPVQTNIRNRKPFEETRAKTQRYYRSPLAYFRRVANTISVPDQ